MSAGHDHGPSPEQAATSPDFRRKLALAFGLVFSVVVAQAVGAWITGSLALLVDVVHSLTDSIGLLVAFIAAVLMTRPPNSKRTWGFRRIEVLAALGQALLLAAVSLYALLEAIERWRNPPEVAGPELLVFGVIALVLNITAALVLASDRKANFNMRAAFLEVLMDALGTLGVIISAILIMTTGYQRADTLAAVAIALMIIPRAALLIKETTAVLMEFTPKNLDLDEVRAHILELEHVQEVHDLHASTVATGLTTLSAHVVVDDECFHDGHAPKILDTVRECVAEHFDVAIDHATFQLETRHQRDNEAATVIHP